MFLTKGLKGSAAAFDQEGNTGPEKYMTCSRAERCSWGQDANHSFLTLWMLAPNHNAQLGPYSNMHRSPLPLTRVYWVSLALQSSVMERHSMSQRIENTVSRFRFRMKISPPSLQALGRPSVFPFFYFQKFNNTLFLNVYIFFLGGG